MGFFSVAFFCAEHRGNEDVGRSERVIMPREASGAYARGCRLLEESEVSIPVDYPSRGLQNLM
jgi:hypothetical protein